MFVQQLNANTGRMIEMQPRTSLRMLAAQASTDDRSWQQLVQQLSAEVDAELARHGFTGSRAEPARRATWRSLASQVQLAPPDDVQAWTRRRAAAEAHRLGLGQAAPGPATEGGPAGRAERDLLPSAPLPRTPDSVAAELLGSRRRFQPWVISPEVCAASRGTFSPSPGCAHPDMLGPQT